MDTTTSNWLGLFFIYYWGRKKKKKRTAPGGLLVRLSDRFNEKPNQTWFVKSVKSCSESCKLKPPHACFWRLWMFISAASKNTHLHSTFSDQREQSKWEALGSELQWTHNQGDWQCLLLSPRPKPIAVEEIIEKVFLPWHLAFQRAKGILFLLLNLFPVKWGKTGRYTEIWGSAMLGLTCQGYGVSSTMVSTFSGFQNWSVSPMNLKKRRQILFLNLLKI